MLRKQKLSRKRKEAIAPGNETVEPNHRSKYFEAGLHSADCTRHLMKNHLLCSAHKSALSRRSFLTRTGQLGAGALMLPTIVRAASIGKSGRTSPGNRIVMGAIGVGGQGTQHVVGGIWTPAGGLVGRDDVQLVAVCDVNAQRLENARNAVNQRYGNTDCAAYRDFRELLARPDIDAVLIATGDRWHPYISIAAARAGKDVYCEKPISLTIEEALVMRTEMRRYGTVFQMGTQQRSSTSFRTACQLVRNGYIGDVKEVIVGVGGPATVRDCRLPAQPVPEWLDYEMWLGPAPWRPYHADYVGGWMAYRDLSGGEMTNWGAHHFDIAQWGLGMDNSGPVEILPPDGRNVKRLTYRYANGALMTQDPDRLARESGQNNGLMFIGTKGKVAVWRYALKTWPDKLARQRIGPNELHLHDVSDDNHHTDFLNAVRTRSRPGSDIAIAARSLTVCHLGNIAHDLNRPVRWNPTTERFVNDPEADRLFARDTRSPWHL
jgi:predicted dehydrogenase